MNTTAYPTTPATAKRPVTAPISTLLLEPDFVDRASPFTKVKTRPRTSKMLSARPKDLPTPSSTTSLARNIPRQHVTSAQKQTQRRSFVSSSRPTPLSAAFVGTMSGSWDTQFRQDHFDHNVATTNIKRLHLKSPGTGYHGRPTGGSNAFRSDTLQLQVEMIERLRALDLSDVMTEQKLQIFRDAFDNVIAVDAVYAPVLLQIKAGYEQALSLKEWSRRIVHPSQPRKYSEVVSEQHPSKLNGTDGLQSP